MLKKLLALVPALVYNKWRYGRYLDVFLTHAPPYHIHDRDDRCHTGFTCFRWFLKTFRPAYHVHGHIHLYGCQEERVSLFGLTTVVNAYGYQVIELPELETRRAQEKIWLTPE
jgi:Icc-related predicted phosphoesterase